MCLQHEAGKVQDGIAALQEEKAQLAAQMEVQAQLLVSPELLQNHSELYWEQAAAAGNGRRLGTARELFVRDRRLTDFRWVMSAVGLAYGLTRVALHMLAHIMSVPGVRAWQQGLAIGGVLSIALSIVVCKLEPSLSHIHCELLNSNYASLL